MEITYVYYSTYSSETAHGKQILHTCNALVEIGHEVTLVAAANVRSYADEHGIPIEFETVRTPTCLPGSRLDRVLYYVTSLAAARSADVLFTRDIRFLKFLSLVPGLRGRHPPLLYEAHKIYHELESMSAEQEQRYVGLADAVITNSKGVAEGLTDMEVDVNAVVSNAARLDLLPKIGKTELRSRYDYTMADFVFVYAGSFDLDKNELDLVIRAFGCLDKPGTHLLLVGGSRTEVDELRKKAAEYGVSDERITFTGHVPHGEVFEYLKLADAGVIPLKKTNQEFIEYTSPLKLYEYLVSNLKVVASDVPAIRNAAGDDVPIFTYEEGNKSSFLDAAGRVIEREATDVETYSYSYRARAEKISELLKTIEPSAN